MKKANIMKRLEGMSDAHFSIVAPYLEADLDAAETLPDFLSEIEAGRASRDKEPHLTTDEALQQARQRISRCP